ncbi:MAG: histidinol dehydrogenase [Phycisphaerales bacterium]|nr:histidinol dehydrogenase [Phycisphaerales bacterium]
MNTASHILPLVEPDRLPPQPDAVDAAAIADAGEIIEAVRTRGEAALREFAQRFGELDAGAPLLLGPADMQAAADRLDPEDLLAIESAAERIEAFARVQLGSLSPVEVPVPGGVAGHTIEPVASAGCYAPGGRYPLPSSVLMTAIPARVAGVERIVVASPRPADATLAAALVAGAGELLCVGGAHAIAALAYGIPGLDPVDFICGPGNRWVTAAKKLVHGRVGIDMLAGPSELLVIADETADPAMIALDLLAQAEHDVAARPILVAVGAGAPVLVQRVRDEVLAQLESLPTASTACKAFANSFAVCVQHSEEAAAVADRLAPEHLQILTRDADALAARVRHAGAVFIGCASAEVFGDYGAGPNHTLPTGATARYGAGLSVFSFLRVRTYLNLREAPADLIAETARLARLEGLEAHARAAEARAK